MANKAAKQRQEGPRSGSRERKLQGESAGMNDKLAEAVSVAQGCGTWHLALGNLDTGEERQIHIFFGSV